MAECRPKRNAQGLEADTTDEMAERLRDNDAPVTQTPEAHAKLEIGRAHV